MNSRIPYVHLDIAGVMKTAADDPAMRRGMSGELNSAEAEVFNNNIGEYSIQ